MQFNNILEKYVLHSSVTEPSLCTTLCFLFTHSMIWVKVLEFLSESGIAHVETIVCIVVFAFIVNS